MRRELYSQQINIHFLLFVFKYTKTKIVKKNRLFYFWKLFKAKIEVDSGRTPTLKAYSGEEKL